MESEPRPRLCFLTQGARGYGFHLHGERNRGGQFIRKVEPGSSADLAGLRPGDRVVEVNGENVEKENHHQVVNRIREVDHRTRLLVVDRDTDDYLHSHGLACTEDLAVEMGTLSPRPSPGPTPSSSPIPRESSPLSPKPNHTQSIPPAGADSPVITQGKMKRSSVTSSKASDPEIELSPESTTDLFFPRLCHVVKGDHGYGFNLHSDKTRRGQFVRSVDPGSAAEGADMRPGDRLVEVNGVNIEGLRHSEVVALIRAGGEEVSLLMVDQVTDKLFHRLGITPTTSHVKESGPPTPPPTTGPPATDPPIINVTLTDSPATEASPKSRANGSSASQSSRSSTTQSEVSSSDMSIQVPDEDDRRVSDPFMDIGLRLKEGAPYGMEQETRDLQQLLTPGYASRTRNKVNGVNIEGLRHSEVVALIRAGGEEVSLLMVDQVTDKLFHRLGITPTTSHVKEVYADESATESGPPTPPPTTGPHATDPPIINVTLTDSPATEASPKSRANGSSASQSSRSSTTQSEVSSSDMSIQVPDEDDRRVSDPFMDIGLRLSPTAAEAKQKALAGRNKKRAPPMEWSKKQEIFSNF
ncbi:putative Na(+)/H(+) exchange regulatory cofactor NHE-RF2 [Scophthalmus maximus]|uniref:Putative Na(+)/H(+) exchange regulatory cofactor NHE-RF2 n=1 Tax=Scophthalmus maximus TaxID=52904 RepID=A0A2U9BPV0_SCOMX|nr:putative Na(+)/H(+) exchange regulatory cofactor NHE-RF2 [Scophthalmus maximus]